MPTSTRPLAPNLLAYLTDTSPMTIPIYTLPASHHAAGHVAAPTFTALAKGQLSTPSEEADGLFTKPARRDNGVRTGV